MHPANVGLPDGGGHRLLRAGQQPHARLGPRRAGRDAAHAACGGPADRRRRCRRCRRLGAGGAAAGRRRGSLLVFACATDSSGVPPDWAADAALLGRGPAARPVGRHGAPAGRRRWPASAAPATPVVVSIHWGANWGAQIPAAHREFAHRLIELGAADIVHGHSSHHPLAIEVYRGRLVLYGCGDLINDYEGIDPHGDLRSDVGCLYFATIEAGSGRAAAAGDRAAADPPFPAGARRRRGTAMGRGAVQLGWAEPASGLRSRPARWRGWALQWRPEPGPRTGL